MNTRARKRTKRAGFTLVEMMVALTAGAFAVAGAYYLTSTSSRLFNDQMSVSEVSSSLRMAMEQVKRDVSRAGFLAARSRTELNDCGGNLNSDESSPKEVNGFAVWPNQHSARALALLNTGANLVRTDRLVLNGNYASSDAYLLDPAYDPTSGVIALQPGHESFARAFMVSDSRDGVPIFQPARFNAMFRTDRMLRIEHMQSGRVFFRQIIGTTPGPASPNPAPPTLTIFPELPALCFTEGEVAVSPVVRVRYQIEAPSDDRAELGLGYEDNSSGRVNAERTVLVRRELDTSNGTRSPDMVPSVGTARVVLDYAVDFQVNAWIDTATSPSGLPPLPGSQPVLQYVSDVISPTLTDIVTNDRAHQFRSAVIMLAARAPEADDRTLCVPRLNLNAPLITFRVPATDAYARCARVRSMKAEVFMPNMAFRVGGS